MKKILIIADGILAKIFLERVMSNFSSDNVYDVVAYRNKTLPEKKLENFKFYNFDPTSFEKLSPLLRKDYFQIMILVATQIDAIATYENIRKVNKEVQIILMDRWSLEIEDNRLSKIVSHNILSSRFADYLPDVPVVAQNIGVGNGEIMEIRVPVGSSYVYRHMGSIEQKKWRIAGIYRANSLILPRPTLMIKPNDTLLVVGDPNVLQNVYRSIKKELGQFPAPFGNNIYCLIDMLKFSEKDVAKVANDALLLHSKINSKKLHIKIINPTASHELEKIKSYNSTHILVEIDYYEKDAHVVLKQDLQKKDIGLIVVPNSFFKEHIDELFQAKIPVLKIGFWGLLNISEGAILSSKSEEIEKESSVIFDISSQLDLNIKLYNFNQDSTHGKNPLVDHFESLSKLFGKKIEIVESVKNPLLKLKLRHDVLQFVPFSSKILESNFFSIFSTDMERQSSRLSNLYQLFIPTSL